MVHRNSKYGSLEDVIVVDFGSGTLSLVSGNGEDHSAVLIKSIEHKRIGSTVEKTKGMSSNDFKPECILRFTNPKSVDVLMKMLRKVKKGLLENSATEPQKN